MVGSTNMDFYQDSLTIHYLMPCDVTMLGRDVITTDVGRQSITSSQQYKHHIWAGQMRA
jgi:hypothetical protein